ncbi:uncharacterized protein LOC117101869 [Anneissia japonica]|uniref:uncharacterized protein LOC117101869 n=1 Tax=Anneissia japonica TaxID=1529436 RepID=UPI001425816B|nr:uncharacterized protein LOC117101869 [Anneissia japonica]
MTERKIDHSDQMTTLQLHKSKYAKPVKPHIPVKPNFLKKQQFNKASNKKLMLITNEDGNVSVITHKNAPPVAPKPKSTFHVRVQHHGRKLQVCPIGHFVKIQTLYDDKNSKDDLEKISCKIEWEEKSANIPTPAPRNQTAKQPISVNANKSSTEVRKNFERIKSNFEVADMHSKPEPRPRSGVNVKIQRVLFEKMLRSKKEGLKMECSVSDNPILIHQNQNSALSQAGGKLPKNFQPLLNSKSSSKSISQRPTSKPSYKALPSQLNMKTSFRDIPLEPNSKPSPSAVVSQHRDISSELISNADSSERIPKPLPRHIPPKPNSKGHSAVLLSKMIPSNLISKSMSSDIPSEFESNPTSSTCNQDAAVFSAKHDIPKITISDEYTDVSNCEHLADSTIENDDNNFDMKNENNVIKVCMDVSTETCLDTEPEACTDGEQGTCTDTNPKTCMDVESESNTNSRAETTDFESEIYAYVKPESDSNEIQHEISDKDIDEHEYVNYNIDGEGTHEYVNVGDFCDTVSGEYIILENDLQTAANDQSTVSEGALSSDSTEGSYDHTYVNYELPSDDYSDIQVDDSGSMHPVIPDDNDSTEDKLGDSAMKSECYEVVLNVSSLKGHASKYRRFSCRQPGRCRRSNFKKQSALKVIDVDEEANNVNDVDIKLDEGSDFASSQEDLKELEGHSIFVEKLKSEDAVTEYTKEHFQDDEEDEGWQSVDSSDFDHDEDTNIRKRSFQHVLSITPEPGESGVSSGNPSPSRLSSSTSDSQVVRVNSCLSFVSSDGFEDGSVRSSISQFSLSDELEGINTCDSFEEDEFTDKENELLEIMKRESTLSDGVQDVEDLKNDTMEHIKKMRKKLAEMKRNVALKNRQRVSLVSEYDIDLPENCKPLEVCNNSNTLGLDANLISDNNITEPSGSGENIIKHKLKEISWQEDLTHTFNNKRTNFSKVKNNGTHSMKSNEDDNRADVQVSLTEESDESGVYISAEVDDEAHTSRRSSLCSYVDPDELTTTSRKQSSSLMEHRTSWRPGIDGAPPIPPRIPSLKLEKQRPNLSVHKTHSAGAVLQTQTKISKKDLRRQSRFVRKEPLFQAYNKDAKLRDTLHFTGNRKHRLSSGRDSPPPLPPPRRQSSVNTKTSQQTQLTPERRSQSFPEIDAEEVNRKPSLKMQRTLWCEVPEVIESGILHQIDDKARKLQEAMFEVITSEASYLRSLDIFVNNFMKADVFNVMYGLLRKEERHHLFSNLLSVRDASERLLLDLEDRFQENYLISDVCDIIIKHATQRNFDMYVTYCLNNQYQIKTLKSLKENPVFVTELGILERSKECGGNNLLSFIMMPFQRITRLPLLIEAIIARLDPESAHIGPATEALNLVKKVAIKCNEEARRMEGIEELTKLAHKLDYKPNIKAIKISDKLLIVKRGDLQWFCHDTSRFNKKKVVSKQIHILVFADKVVLTKRKIKNDREVFEVFDWCPRNLVDVKAVELKHDTLLEDYKNVMMVVFLQNHEKKEKKYFINTTSE